MANQEQLAILKQGVEAWNQWREENPGVVLDLRKADLRNADLSSADLISADLRNADLRKADLISADLRKADFGSADLSNAKLIDANLFNADLRNTKLIDANLFNADLRNTKLIDANLFNADLRNAKLIDANLFNADLRNANLHSANLFNADLSKANLRSATLSDAKFSSANLSSANLWWARLWGTKLIGANLSGANLCHADFGSANLRHADLRHAKLNDAKLNDADLRKADFGSANLSYAKLRNASLREADFSSADLSNVDLSGAALINANLINANLISANLTLAKVPATDFKEANLSGACIQDWQITSDTKLEGVRCDFIYRKAEWNWKKNGYEFSQRLPADPNISFSPGEFVQRFQILASALETIDLTFTEGINWQAFFASFKDLRNQHPDEMVAIQGMERKGDAFVVRLEVGEGADKGAIETEIKQRYHAQLELTEARYRAELAAKDREIEIYKQQGADMTEIAKLLASRSPNMNFHGPVGSVLNHGQQDNVSGQMEGDQHHS